LAKKHRSILDTMAADIDRHLNVAGDVLNQMQVVDRRGTLHEQTATVWQRGLPKRQRGWLMLTS
jgi:hypothetical protein